MDMSATMRIHQPYPGLFAYYDGRIPGKRLHSPEPNWLDDGAYSLGVASFALVSGSEALVYDTHISLDHARAVRRHLEGLGVTAVRVVMSHWHTDHVAGNGGFADCPILANSLTVATLKAKQAVLEAKNPPIRPVVMPSESFEGELSLTVGSRNVRLMQFDIHSADGTVLVIPELGVMLAGDTLEDTVTYISEPEHIHRHIRDLKRMAKLPIRRILPNHGCEEVIAAGGYPPSLIDANRLYLERLLSRRDDPQLGEQSLAAFAEPEISSGAIFYFAPYEEVHAQNIAVLRGAPSDE
jgi:glyoxylase-like metal-dependent hydrolase (beta-lactamase superfamily II)